MGYGVGKKAIARWRESEYQVLKSICIKYEIELAPPKKSVGSKSVELYKEEKRLEEKVQKLREMELAADNTEVPYKKRLIGGGYILTEEEYAKFSEEKKAVSVQKADAEIKVCEAEEITRQTESRRLVLYEREETFEKKKTSDEKQIEERLKRTNEALWNASLAEHNAQALVKEQQEINDVLQDTKEKLRKAAFYRDKYKWENSDLKKEIAANDKKHKEEVERLSAEYSEKIETLTENVVDRDKTISVQKSKINQFELEIKVKDETIRKDKEDIEILESICKDACNVGKYACRKLGQDFDRCLKMRTDNYRLSYIFGDERSR